MVIHNRNRKVDVGIRIIDFWLMMMTDNMYDSFFADLMEFVVGGGELG